MLSRREWITRLLLIALGLTGFVGRSTAQTGGKVTKEAAKYQDHPNNMQMCGMCKFYTPPGGKAGAGMMGGPMGPGIMGGQGQGMTGGQGMMGGQSQGMMGQGMMGQGMTIPGTCEVVEGQISPMGWCVLYRPVSS